MSEAVVNKKRCAVYTRKSTEEGLDQEYNSIHAQTDAGHAYIASQRHEGWTPVADDYDDPAYSGGSMNRPALQRLMQDIKDDKIDIVVVYKIDRLTRSLADFSQMISVFDQHGVSFVAVTQQFNTTSSMGRLTLNILLSFAQFEREVTSERIRDKIEASKKRGMWMGGIPPLGYDVKDRRLVPNKKEAKLVKRMFTRFVELGSVTLLIRELRLENVTSKSWTTQDGRYRPGKPIDKGMVYKFLHNRTYLGKIHHKENWYDADHEPLIDQKLFDDAHAILETNGRVRGCRTRSKVQFLLKGIVFGSDGHAMTAFSTTKRKGGKRYRYYVPSRENKEFAGASGLSRFPAAELEAMVMAQLRETMRSPQMIEHIVPPAMAMDDELDEAKVTVAMGRLDTIWDNLFPAEQDRIVRLLVEKVVVSPTEIEVRMQMNGLETVTRELIEVIDQKTAEAPA